MTAGQDLRHCQLGRPNLCLIVDKTIDSPPRTVHLVTHFFALLESEVTTR